MPRKVRSLEPSSGGFSTGAFTAAEVSGSSAEVVAVSSEAGLLVGAAEGGVAASAMTDTEGFGASGEGQNRGEK